MRHGSRGVLASGHAAPVTALAPARGQTPSAAAATDAEVVASTAEDGVARLWRLGGGCGLHAVPLLECRCASGNADCSLVFCSIQASLICCAAGQPSVNV